MSKHRATAIIEVSGEIEADDWVTAAEIFIKTIEVRAKDALIAPLIEGKPTLMAIPNPVSSITASPLRVFNTVLNNSINDPINRAFQKAADGENNAKSE